MGITRARSQDDLQPGARFDARNVLRSCLVSRAFALASAPSQIAAARCAEADPKTLPSATIHLQPFPGRGAITGKLSLPAPSSQRVFCSVTTKIAQHKPLTCKEESVLSILD